MTFLSFWFNDESQWWFAYLRFLFHVRSCSFKFKFQRHQVQVLMLSFEWNQYAHWPVKANKDKDYCLTFEGYLIKIAAPVFCVVNTHANLDCPNGRLYCRYIWMGSRDHINRIILVIGLVTRASRMEGLRSHYRRFQIGEWPVGDWR